MSNDAKPGRLPVLVLAAGRGQRLAPRTDRLPKCLLPIGGSSPLEILLGQLDALPVSELILVVGHAHEHIETFVTQNAPRFAVQRIFNPRYDTANNIYSIHLAAEVCAQGFVLVNSDVVCDPRILGAAFAPPDETLLMIDPAHPPRAEAMKVRYADGRLIQIAKTLDPAASDGEYIGIARFDAAGARHLFAAVAELLAQGRLEEWYEAAIGLACRKIAVGRRSTESLPWVEIDDPEDLERAAREIIPHLGTSPHGG